MTAVEVTFGTATSRGQRPRNEDAIGVRMPVFVVADGMGGHQAGDVAAELAVRAFDAVAGRADVSIEDLTACLRETGERVRGIATGPGLGAGATITGVCVTHQNGTPYWIVFNLGDSRTYRLADGELTQISVDHSEVQELVEAGTLRPDDVSSHPRRHVVTRALGAHAVVDPDFWLLPLGAHDRMLLCSDGLSGEVRHDVLEAVLLGEPDPQRAADALVAEALLAGSRDNISAVVVDAVTGITDVQTQPQDEEADDEDTVDAPARHDEEVHRP